MKFYLVLKGIKGKQEDLTKSPNWTEQMGGKAAFQLNSPSEIFQPKL
jgi:hypothetical protein